MAERFVLPDRLPGADLTVADLVAELGEDAARAVAVEVDATAPEQWAQWTGDRAARFERLLRRARARRQAQEAVANWRPDPATLTLEALRAAKSRKRDKVATAFEDAWWRPAGGVAE